jgi:tetratricopeptide (TPR) repeat protein
MGAEACGKAEAALRAWDRVRMPFVGRPNLARAWVNRAARYTQRGDYTRAVSAASRAIEFASAWAYAYYVRGDAHQRNGNYDAALADLDRALDLCADHALALAVRARIHVAKGNCDQAIHDATRAIDLMPGFVKRKERQPDESALYGTRPPCATEAWRSQGKENTSLR